jgi:acetoacetate decarboxylase
LEITTMNQEKMRTTAFAMPLTNPAFPPVEKQIGDMWLFSSLMLMS